MSSSKALHGEFGFTLGYT